MEKFGHFGDSESMWHSKVTSGGRTERLVIRAGRSHDKELQQIMQVHFRGSSVRR